MLRETLTPAQASEQLATARREAAEANTLAAELADRVRDGDTNVTAEQLGTQKQLAELAQLRVEAAERKLAKAITADRDARCKAAVQDALNLLDVEDSAPVVQAVTAIREGVANLLAVCAARNAEIHDAGVRIAALDHELEQIGVPGSMPLWGQYGARGNARHITARDPERGHLSADALDPVDLAAAAVLTALAGHPEPRHVAERFRLPDPSIRRLGETIPGLADAWRCTWDEWAGMRNTTGQTRASGQGRTPLPKGSEG